jgi:H+/Cl- antiporter ClcA
VQYLWWCLSASIVGLVVWSVVDASRRPASAFEPTAKTKRNWIISIIGFAVICGPIGGLYSLYYLLNVRQSLASASTEV